MSYKYTINLGNEIQSIAARQFLPKIDYFIDHEKIHLFKNSQKVKMIMNGWYLDCLDAWPPSKDIDPLLISMHFNTSINDTKNVIFTPESRDFFSSYGPVGCRDAATLKMLEENDIDAYHSGCLTLTLHSSKPKNDLNYVVVNSNKSEDIIAFLKTKTDLPVYDVNQVTMLSYDEKYLLDTSLNQKMTSFYDVDEKFLMAENLLNIYENASCVITDRMHTALPSLALKTPVLFINNATYGLERLSGITDLVREITLNEYKENYSVFDVENPPKNPKNYLKLRKDLTNRAKSFTGYMGKDYSSFTNDEQDLKNKLLISRTYDETKKYMSNVNQINSKNTKKINSQKKKIDLLEKRIQELESKNKEKKDKKLFSFLKKD